MCSEGETFAFSDAVGFEARGPWDIAAPVLKPVYVSAPRGERFAPQFGRNRPERLLPCFDLAY
jgi:hypothetical protein